VAGRPHVGVLALQGAFREHITMLEALGVDAVPVRLPDQLAGLSGLVIPGGESTAISRLMESYGFFDPALHRRFAEIAVWGTCAGTILIARDVLDAIEGQRTLGLMDVSVRRNAFGRQVDSFEADLHIRAGIGRYRGVFIRAPWIEKTGKGVEVLAEHSGRIVAARQGKMLATVFHPELTGDTRMHRYFLEQVVGSR